MSEWEPTNELRWELRKPDPLPSVYIMLHILQQIWRCESSALGGSYHYEWRDVATVKQEKNNGL